MGNVATNTDGITATLRAKAAEYQDLPERAREFSVAYAIEGVKNKAAMAAGYAKSSASNAAVKWLRDRRVLSLIAELRGLLPDLANVDPTAIQARLAMLSMTDVAGMLVPDERFPDADPVIYRWKRPEELTAGERALVQDVTLVEVVNRSKDDDGIETVTTRQEFKYKVLNQKDSLDSLARTFGMFRDKVEHEHKHKIDAVFQFIAKHPEQSETVAMLNHRHGRVIEGQAKRISHNDPGSDPYA